MVSKTRKTTEKKPLRNRNAKNNAVNFPMPVHNIENKFSHQTEFKKKNTHTNAFGTAELAKI